MSVLTHVNSKSLHGGYTPIGTYHSLTIPAVTSGNSLVMILALESGESLTTAPSAWNGTVDTPLVYLTSETVGSTTWRLYQLDNITTAPTSIRWKLNVENFTYVDVFEIGGTGGVAPTHKLNQKTSPFVDGFTFSQGYTTTTPDEFVIAHVSVSSGGTQTPTAPFTLVTHGNYGFDSFYNSNAGDAGSKTLEWSSQYYAGVTLWLVSFGNSATDPTVTTVTSSGVTEGGNGVYTVTLSGATNRTTNYSTSLSGTATSADYNNALGSATYSDGVIFSGGDFVVPSGVSSFTVTIATTQDALDEDNETLILTVGGTASTGGTITDDDASPALLIPGPVTVDSGDSVVASYTLGAVSGRVTYARLVLTDGTAVGGTNYTNTFPAATLSNGVTINAGVLSIPAGVAGFTITIPTAA